MPQIPEHVSIVSHEQTDEVHKIGEVEHPVFKAFIKDEERLYYIELNHYKPTCGCQELRLKFGYNHNNNGLSAYCLHCDYKHSKGLKLVKNSGNRNCSDHAYFKFHQEELDRLFCEMCLSKKYLKIHHIIEHQHGADNEPENLQLLCGNCHTIVHSIRSIKGEK